MDYIDEYLQTLVPSERDALQRIRTLIHEVIPEITETKSYGMPGFKYKGKYVAGFFAFKDHLSLFPGATVEYFADRLTDYKTSKGTIQFTADKQLPKDLVVAIIEKRKAEIDA